MQRRDGALRVPGPRLPSSGGSSWADAGVPVLLAVVSASTVLLAALLSGGYFPRDVLLLALIAILGCVVGLFDAPAGWRPSGAARAMMAGLLLLTAGTALSSTWSPDPAAALLAAQRDLGYAAAFLLALLASRTGRSARLLLNLLIVALVGVCLLALLSRLTPAVFPTDSALLVISQGRLSYPVTYWNGLGAIAAMALLGTIGLAADHRSSALVRGIAAAAGPIAGVVLYLTLSRASILAAVAAGVVMLAISPWRPRLVASAAVIVGAAAIGVLVVRGHPILIDAPATPEERGRVGGPVLAWVLATAVAAGTLQAAFTRSYGQRSRRSRSGASSRTQGPPPPRSGRVVLGIAAVLVILVAIVAGLTTFGDGAPGRVAGGFGDARSAVDRQYREFLDPTQAPSSGQDRLGEARSSRSEAFRVALAAFAEDPVTGDGAGGYRIRWFEERRIDESIRNAHSLPLETLAELGLMGVLALLLVLLPLAASVGAARRRSGKLSRCQAASAGGIVVVWLVHAAVDWDWQLAAVTTPALIAGAVLFSSTRTSRAGSAFG